MLYLVPPLNQSTYDHIKPDVAPGFLNYLRSKSRSLLHFRVAEDVITCWPDEYFDDAEHLNEAGARKYSASLNEILTRLLAGDAISKLPDQCQRHVISAGPRF